MRAEGQSEFAFKLEPLALKWVMVEKFKDYLCGAKFVVFTDNRPLLHLKTARKGVVEQRCSTSKCLLGSIRTWMACPGGLGRLRWLRSRLKKWAERQGQDPEVDQVREWVATGFQHTLEVKQALSAIGRCL